MDDSEVCELIAKGADLLEQGLLTDAELLFLKAAALQADKIELLTAKVYRSLAEVVQKQNRPGRVKSLNMLAEMIEDTLQTSPDRDLQS